MFENMWECLKMCEMFAKVSQCAKCLKTEEPRLCQSNPTLHCQPASFTYSGITHEIIQNQQFTEILLLFIIININHIIYWFMLTIIINIITFFIICVIISIINNNNYYYYY